MATERRTLVIGYGNPGRQDDGLGPAFIDRLLQVTGQNAPSLSAKSCYQLTVEDAHELQDYDQIIFVDASINSDAPFQFGKIAGNTLNPLASHSLTPESLLQLCDILYQHLPEAFMLAIRGYEFDKFEEKLTPQADHNCQAALSMLFEELGLAPVVDCLPCEAGEGRM